jgi:hypothetical protein
MSVTPIGRPKMTRNIGTVDLVIRSILGMALIAYFGKDGAVLTGSELAILAGAYLLGTGIFSYCPLYHVLGLTTYGRLDRLV